MKNELCITFEKTVVVVKYHFPIQREQSLLDAIKNAWEKKEVYQSHVDFLIGF